MPAILQVSLTSKYYIKIQIYCRCRDGSQGVSLLIVKRMSGPSLLAIVAALVVPGILFIRDIANLLPLYTNTAVRNAAQSTLTTVADREGWLLSDILVQHVTNDALQVTHRRHIRGNDPEACYVITLKDASLHPCDAKLN